MTGDLDWNPQEYLPDDGETFEQLSRARAAVLATGTPGLHCAVMQSVPPDPWRAVGTVMALSITHPEVPGSVQVYWLAENPAVVRVASATGFRPAAATDPPPHQPRFELAALLDPVHSRLPSLVTADAEAVAAWVARWHLTATEVLYPTPAVPRRPVPTAPVSITWEEGDARLAAATSDLDVERLGALVPRTARGTLDRKTTMLLAPLDDSSDARRSDWIIARYAGPASLIITVDAVIAANHWYRLDVAPWLWRRDTVAPAEWMAGSDPIRNEQIGLIEGGAIPAALELAGVEMDDGTRRLLSGRRLSWWSDRVADSWPSGAVEAFAPCAPWLIAGPAHRHVVERCRRGSDGARLVILPHQPQQSKVGISLVPGPTPRLEVRSTASNRVLPLPLWQRLDTLHTGIARGKHERRSAR